MSDDELRDLAKVDVAAAKAIVAGNVATSRAIAAPPVPCEADGFVTMYVSAPLVAGPRS